MKIRRRIFIFLLAPLLALVLGGSALAISNDNPIWSGLWSGSNFDFSHLFDTDSTNKTPVPQPPPRPNKTYAALGDSVAAGMGLNALPNPSSQDTQCARSSQAYPQLLAASQHYQLTHLACSGAMAGDLVTKQHVSGPDIPAQLDEAYARGTPSLLTITAGANDAHWESFLSTCYTTNCDRESTKLLATSYLGILETKLHYMFISINSRNNGSPPKVIVTGYYNPISSECANLTDRLTQGELAWFDSEVSALNDVLKRTSAQYSYVTFVPIDFTGHDICSSDPWVQGLADKAPFHPTAQGQQVIARSIENALQ